MAEVRRVQQKHVSCIQDPEGVHPFTQIGTLKKSYSSCVEMCPRIDNVAAKAVGMEHRERSRAESESVDCL